MANFNKRFAKPARNPKDVHRTLSAHDDVDDDAACVKHQRTVSNSLTVLYDKVIFILEKSEPATSLARKRVTVCDYPDGRLEIQHAGIRLPYRTFDKLRRVKRADVVENKHLDHALAFIAEQQQKQPTERSKHSPRRRGHGPNMFDLAEDKTTP